MHRALAVPGEDDRPVAGLDEELVEGEQNVAIGEIDRFRGLGLIGEEGAERGLAVTRRPDRADLVERAGLTLGKEGGAIIGFLIVERRVPAGANKVGGRMDEEHRCLGLGGGLVTGGRPQTGITGLVGPGDPHPGIAIGIARQARHGLEGTGRYEGEAHQLLAEQIIGEAARNGQHDEDREDIKKLPRQGLGTPNKRRNHEAAAALLARGVGGRQSWRRRFMARRAGVRPRPRRQP